VKALHTPDLVIALLEDAVAIVGAVLISYPFLIVRRLREPLVRERRTRAVSGWNRVARSLKAGKPARF